MQAIHAPRDIASTLRGFVGYFMKPRSQLWLARLILTSSILVTAGIGYLEPLSFQQRVLSNIDGGLVFLLLVMVLAFVAWIDTVVNDLLPDRFRIEWTDRNRLWIFGALMMAEGALVWLNGAHNASWLLVARYGVDTLGCGLVCVFDTVARAKHVNASRMP